MFAVSLVWVVGFAGLAWWYFHPPVDHEMGIVYGHRSGRELIFDVLTPRNANSLGVLFLVSGNWKSSPEAIQPWIVAALL